MSVFEDSLNKLPITDKSNQDQIQLRIAAIRSLPDYMLQVQNFLETQASARPDLFFLDYNMYFVLDHIVKAALPLLANWTNMQLVRAILRINSFPQALQLTVPVIAQVITEFSLRVMTSSHLYPRSFMSPLFSFEHSSLLLTETLQYWERRHNQVPIGNEEKMLEDLSVQVVPICFHKLAYAGVPIEMSDSRVIMNGITYYREEEPIKQWTKKLFCLSFTINGLTRHTMQQHRADRTKFATAIAFTVARTSILAKVRSVGFLGFHHFLEISIGNELKDEWLVQVDLYDDYWQLLAESHVPVWPTLWGFPELTRAPEIDHLMVDCYTPTVPQSYLVNWEKQGPKKALRLLRKQGYKQKQQILRSDKMAAIVTQGAEYHNYKSRLGLYHPITRTFDLDVILEFFVCLRANSMPTDIETLFARLFHRLSLPLFVGEKFTAPALVPGGSGVCSFEGELCASMEKIKKNKDFFSFYLNVQSHQFSDLENNVNVAISSYFAIRKPDKGLLAWVSEGPSYPSSAPLGHIQRVLGCQEETVPRRFFPHGLQCDEWTVFRVLPGSIKRTDALLWFVIQAEKRYYYPFIVTTKPRKYCLHSEFGRFQVDQTKNWRVFFRDHESGDTVKLPKNPVTYVLGQGPTSSIVNRSFNKIV